MALAVALLAPAAGSSIASAQTITTVAGNGANGFSGDGGPATVAALNGARGVAWTSNGGFLFVDYWNQRVRRVAPNGTVTTVAGNGKSGYTGDNVQATSTRLNLPHDVAALADGGFLIDDENNQRIRRVGTDGVIRTVAGTGSKGNGGDGTAATGAKVNSPRSIAATSGGGFLISDSDNYKVRCVTSAGRISTIAGRGSLGFSGDGGKATSAQLDQTFGVSPTYDGGVLIADRGNNRIREITPDGKIRTVAGNGSQPNPNDDGIPAPGDGGKATSAAVRATAVAALPGGGFLIGDAVNDRVRRVSTKGIITTVAGNGAKLSTGDGGPAQLAGVFSPRDLTVRSDSAYLIAEFGADDAAGPGGDRVRFVGGQPFKPFPQPAFKSGCDYKPLVTLARSAKARAKRSFSVRFKLRKRAKVTLEIKKGKKRVYRKSLRANGGRRRFVVRKKLKAGKYSVQLSARSSDRQLSRAKSRLTLKRR